MVQAPVAPSSTVTPVKDETIPQPYVPLQPWPDGLPILLSLMTLYLTQPLLTHQGEPGEATTIIGDGAAGPLEVDVAVASDLVTLSLHPICTNNPAASPIV